MGNFITGSVDYQVPIPASAANGKATLAWAWINREGNREYYMNCVDIEITGGKSSGGSISGKNLLLANLPGQKIFPEFFPDTYGQELFDAQPIITVSPNGSGTVIDPNPKPDLISDKPKPRPEPTPGKSKSTSDKPEPTSDQLSPKPEPTPVEPEPEPKPHPGKCQDGLMYCQDSSIAMCFGNKLYPTPCAGGAKCSGNPGQAQCL